MKAPEQSRETRHQTNLQQVREAVGRAVAGSAMAAYDRVATGRLLYRGYASAEFMNFGLWENDTASRPAASSALMRMVLEAIDQPCARVLDVACGLGATTREIIATKKCRSVIGLNLSAAQLASARVNAPSAAFVRMDAPRLGFADQTFDHVVCVEAAFHFNTRATFVREAYRVLRPGGTLVLTDLLLHADAADLLPDWNAANHVSDIEGYRATFVDAGFTRVLIRDITRTGITGYLRHMFTKVHEDWLTGACDFVRLQAALGILYRVAVSHQFNILCQARKGNRSCEQGADYAKADCTIT